MFEQVESTIGEIISHCLHESISNQQKTPFPISSTQIIEFFPASTKSSIQRVDITEKFNSAWHLRNATHDCYFGLKCIVNNESTRMCLVELINQDGNHKYFDEDEKELFIQPSCIHRLLISKQVTLEWSKWTHCNASGIVCRFQAMGRLHEFAILPFCRCRKFTPNADAANAQPAIVDNGTSDGDAVYDDWYLEQYLEFYGFYDERHNKRFALQTISENIAFETYHENGSGQHADKEEEEDIDLNVKPHAMNREKCRRKRTFHQFDERSDDLIDCTKPHKRRRFND